MQYAVACALQLRSRPTEIVRPQPTSAAATAGTEIVDAAQCFSAPAVFQPSGRPVVCHRVSCDLPCLLVPKMPIDCALRQKLVVAVYVHDLAAIDHQNRVRFRKHRQPVRNDDDGATFGESTQISPND